MNSNGKAYYASQKKSYQDMKDSAITSQSLAVSQHDYYEKRRKQLNNSPLGTLFTYDESGQLAYKAGSYDWMANLFKADQYGNQKLSSKQQYEAIIAKNKDFAQYMKYDESGKKINRKDYKSEDEYYQAMVKAFSDRMDSEQEEMQNLFDSWNEQEKAVLEQMQAMNEQLQAMKDNQKEVEEAVLGAIVEMREREIEEMQNTRDAIEETNEAFINGLQNSLDKERKMYEDNQNDQELQRNRRQLAILQRSGASASQIAQLQEKVDQQAQDQYFEKQQEQIDAIQEASDNQIERLDHQIELQQEQLEYEKAHGLLWGEVYQVMAQEPEKITEFIIKNSSSFWSSSPLQSSDDFNDTLFKATQWGEFRKDSEMQNAALSQVNQSLDIFLGAMEQIYGKDVNWKQIKKTAETKYNKLYDKNNQDPEITAWQAYKKASKEATPEPEPAKDEGGGKKNNNGSNSNDSGRTDKESKWYSNDTQHWHRHWNGKGEWYQDDLGNHNWDSGTLSSDKKKITKKCTVCGRTKTEDAPVYYTFKTESVGNKGASGGSANNGTMAEKPFAKGGIDDYTGLAMLHGTPQEPEGILNADDYKAWKQDIKTTNLLYNALADVSAAQSSSVAAISSTTNNQTGISIENAVVNMNATIANDYDARRAGEQALEQMLTIARKSGTRSAQRR